MWIAALVVQHSLVLFARDTRFDVLPQLSRASGFAGVGQVIENREVIGGASRDRTDDLIVANDALSQLSYSPNANGVWWSMA